MSGARWLPVVAPVVLFGQEWGTWSIEINDDCVPESNGKVLLPLDAETTVGGVGHLPQGPTGLWASAARGRAATATRTLAAYLHEQGSILKTAQRLHLYRNAVADRIRGITELLDVDFEDPDQRLAHQFTCRARLLG